MHCVARGASLRGRRSTGRASLRKRSSMAINRHAERTRSSIRSAPHGRSLPGRPRASPQAPVGMCRLQISRQQDSFRGSISFERYGRSQAGPLSATRRLRRSRSSTEISRRGSISRRRCGHSLPGARRAHRPTQAGTSLRSFRVACRPVCRNGRSGKPGRASRTRLSAQQR